MTGEEPPPEQPAHVPEVPPDGGVPNPSVAGAEATPNERLTLAAVSDQVGAIGKIAAAVVALGGLVYCVGGVVLVARLVNQDLPWQPVISQLPRDLLFSVGVTPILLGASAGLLYVGWRLIRASSNPPMQQPTRGRRIGWFLITWSLLMIPAATVAAFKTYLAQPRLNWDWGPLLVCAIVMALVAGVAVRTRQKLSHMYTPTEWLHPVARGLTAATYALISVPAFMAAMAITPLSDAKVCTTSDFEERGQLIGRTGDSIALGEPRARQKRLALLPSDKVGELFVGPQAWTAKCDFSDARSAVLAQREAAASDAAAGLIAATPPSSSLATPLDKQNAQTLIDRIGDVVLASLKIADLSGDLNVNASGVQASADHLLLRLGPTRAAVRSANRHSAASVIATLSKMRSEVMLLAKAGRDQANALLNTAVSRQAVD